MKKLPVIAAITCAAALVLASCSSGASDASGSSGSSGSSTDESSSTQESDNSSVDLDTATPDQLYAAAKKEGQVTVYSYTSRIAAIKTAFEKKYPGVTVNGVDLSTTKMIARLKAESKAGTSTADVAFLSGGGAQVLSQLVEPGLVTKYIPPQIKTTLPEKYQEPLPANQLSTKVMLYNADAYPDGCPITNLWQLTEPKWKGKVLMVDPSVRGEYLSLMTEFVTHSQDMAKAYQDEFGQPITLDAGVADAGHQFIKDLYANGLVLTDDTDTINAAVGAKGQDAPPVGFSSYDDTRDNATKGWALHVATGVTPATGITYGGMLGVVKGAPHPAAARLMIDFLFGDGSATGGPGFAPFYVTGGYPTLTSTELPPDTVSLDALNAWQVTPKEIGPVDDKVSDYLLTLG